MMKNRRKRGGLSGGDVVVSWRRFFRFVSLFVFSFVLFSALFIFLGKFRPVVRISTLKSATVKAVFGGSVPAVKVVAIHEAVKFPDQTLIFLNRSSTSRLYTKDDLFCVFSDAKKLFKELPLAVEIDDVGRQIVQCSAVPRGHTISLAVSRWTVDNNLPVGPTHRWDWLVYDAVIDQDNSTVVFVKGLNLRSGKIADVSRYECVYGWDLTNPNLMLRAEVTSAAQEIVRCRTPLTVLDGPRSPQSPPVKVSVRIKGSGMLPSIAHPITRLGRVKNPTRGKSKPFETCVCTMTRNAASVLREWVMYHAGIGVQRWFIYDNNSDDDLVSEIKNLEHRGYNISRHFWPWIKTQEAGFAHCVIRARSECDWVAFIDVDEFFYIPSGQTLTEVIRNHTTPSPSGEIGEIRTPCHSFGPSGLRDPPREGVTAAYTCRMLLPERHKSIIRPESLNATLINVVHHFHLREGFTFADMDMGTMVINHYKYQVWDIFKEKFKRRVATYVADWQNEENVGSKDRAPGLGTRPVEPPDWAERFCEVRDVGLRDWVIQNFMDRKTQRLVWEREGKRVEDEVVAQMGSWADKRVGRKRKKQLKAK